MVGLEGVQSIPRWVSVLNEGVSESPLYLPPQPGSRGTVAGGSERLKRFFVPCSMPSGAVISCLCLTFPHCIALLFHAPIEAKDLPTAPILFLTPRV